MSRLPALLLAALLALLLLAPSVARAAPATIEGYPDYQPATRCAPKVKPGTQELGHWLVKRYGGGFGPISRPCGGSVSEHTEGRAFDWTNDVRSKAARQRVRAFLSRIRATDRAGNTDALARRMGIMYVIWNDRIFSAWNSYAPEKYRSSSCRSIRKCSTTLRHRDHVHVSLTRRAAQQRTSWYLARLAG